MKIQEAATKIISQWEHGGRYDCHGDGAYGLIGWQGDQLTILLEEFVKEGGELQYQPQTYAQGLLKHKQNERLNDLAKDPLMRVVQLKVAHLYMASAIEHQQTFYPFETALAQLVLCDMGVNNGIYNRYVQDVVDPLQGGPVMTREQSDEQDVIRDAMMVRIQAMKNHGIWDKYEGIRRRYSWYQQLLQSDMRMDMRTMQPTVKVNGNKVNLGNDPIISIKP